MNNTLKILILSMLITVFGQCSDEKEKNALFLHGSEEHNVSDGLLEDWGDAGTTHYNMNFSLIGENTVFELTTLSAASYYYEPSETIDFYIFAELISPGTGAFKTGTFHPLGDKSLEEMEGKFAYRRLYFGYDFSERIQAVSGTATLSGGENNHYKLALDVVLENGNHLKGSYTGLYTYFDRRQ